MASEDADSLAGIYIPGLTHPELFGPLPPTDAISSLLSRQTSPTDRPHRDLSGDVNGQSIPHLVTSQAWRAAATCAHDAITEFDPTATQDILQLWVIRLTALHALRLNHLLQSELASLLHVILQTIPLPSLIDLSPGARHPIHPAIPFPLLVFRARIWETSSAIGCEPRFLSIDSLSQLLRASRAMAIQATRSKRLDVAESWKIRTRRIALVLASLVAGLDQPGSSPEQVPADPISAHAIFNQGSKHSPTLTIAKAKFGFALGDLQCATDAIERLKGLPDMRPADSQRAIVTLTAIGSMARGDWVSAATQFQTILDDTLGGDLSEVRNNLAVALLYSGRFQEALDVMCDILFKDEASVVDITTEPFLYNFATILELRSTEPVEAKRSMLLRASTLAKLEGTRAGAFKLG